MPRLRKGLLVFVWLLGLVSFAFSSNIRADGSVLVVNEVPILKLMSTGVDGAKPDERAERLVSTLESVPSFGDIKIRKEANTHVIFVGGIRILTITPQEAKLHKTSTAALAVSWTTNLRGAFALPALKLGETSIRTAPPAKKYVKVIGSWAHLAEASSDNADVATVTRVSGGLIVNALSPGNATITVAAPDSTQTIQVVVRPYAAIFPQTLSATVTGSPTALASTVEGAIASTIRNQLKALPNASWKWLHVTALPVRVGQAKTFTVRVSAEASDGFPSSGDVNVIVRNLPLRSQKDAELWYSNDPEDVRQAGPLFWAKLRKDVPARLLYHHINKASFPMYLRVQAINDTDEAARVALMPGDSVPDRNPVRAGMRAALQYFRAWSSGSGEVVTIPPHSSLPISLRRLETGETASGLCGLRLIDGPQEILVRTDAWPPFPLDPKWTNAIASSTPWREVGVQPINDLDRAPFEPSPHIYPDPYRVEAVDYQVGGRYGFVRIGQRPIARIDNTGGLDGNFGVIYNIRASMQNKTQEPTDVEVVFESSAGYSGGLFLVDGQVVETPLMQPKAESQIAKFHLQPGDSRSLDIVTVPLSGSSYPATIMIRPVSNLSAGFVPAR